MESKMPNGYIKVDKSIKQEGTPLQFTGRNITVENRFSTIHIPIPKNPGEVDLKIKTSVNVPVRKNFSFLYHWSPCLSIVCIILVIGMMTYRNSELRQKVVSLSRQVDILNIKSEALHKLLLIQQDRLDSVTDRLNSVTSEHRAAGDVRFFDKINSNVSVVKTQNTSGAKNQSVASEENRVAEFVVDDFDNIPLLTEDFTLKDSILHRNETAVETVLKSGRVEDIALAAVEQGAQLARVKRSNKRGNKRKSGPRHGGNVNKKSKNHGATVLHLEGGAREQNIGDTGLIAPWFIDKNASESFLLKNFTMRDGEGSVEIQVSGLYYIYAQVCYLTSELTNSFTISLKNGGNPTELALCSVMGSTGSHTEVTCFTSVVRYLNKNDRVFLHQRERKRKILLKDSFLGIVQLAS